MQDGAGAAGLGGRLSLMIGYLLFVRCLALLTLADGPVMSGEKEEVPLTYGHVTHQK